MWAVYWADNLDCQWAADLVDPSELWLANEQYEKEENFITIK